MINDPHPLYQHRKSIPVTAACQHLCFKSNDLSGEVICDDCGVNIANLSHTDPTTWTGSTPRAREVALNYQNAIKLLGPLIDIGPDRNISRIKHVRDSNGLTLKEAKKVTDYIIRKQLDKDSDEVTRLKDQLGRKEAIIIRMEREAIDDETKLRDQGFQLDDNRQELKSISKQLELVSTWLAAAQRLTQDNWAQKAKDKVIEEMINKAHFALPIIPKGLIED